MFDIDRWQEIFETIRKNKLRTFLTGISVASGIFILVILLGFGQGMENGIRKEFEADATNRIWVWTRVTTKEYKGLNPGRRIELSNEDYANLNTLYKDDIEYKSDLFRIRGATINYKEESVSYGVNGISPNYQQIENQSMVLGRYINYADLKAKNKVIVISRKIQKELLKDIENPLNEYVQLSGINFKIIGIYSDAGGDREEDRVFIPITTAQNIFNGANKIANLGFTVKPEDNFDKALAVSNQFTDNVKRYLQESHIVAPDDTSAINVHNAINEAKRFYTLTSNIAAFFWFVGICTIIAGVVGVSNIMLIIVKERTKEIGIRKALGAKPWSIIGMILQESIFVTGVSGFAGLILSMALLEVVGPNIEVDYVLNPSVNFSMAITMVIVLIIAGALAGFIPAWKAAHIQPVKALSHE
ncbi:putative ABC transport system permease protein [Lutibacter agarilyticus]|uniref:Putative ABC transport system permease protein n=1 Tax=Lutibacter agarilyticus TaxID=1109740 RepID=A0A238VJ76_9FLAO|nr:ABC transporter permease [Lutibacter agarilyticus]SNR34425.1 putative ABC transport system permease protein [Lutibacter agarilyticus]